jgi:hypothetical protein
MKKIFSFPLKSSRLSSPLNLVMSLVVGLWLSSAAFAGQYPDPLHANMNDSFPCTHCYPCSLKPGGLPLCKDGMKDPFVAAFTGAIPQAAKTDVAQ